MIRLGPQTLAVTGVLALLALVAVLTSRREAPPPVSFDSSDYGADGYRAWAALLAREGVATTRFVLRPVELDDAVDTLISAQPPQLQSNPMIRGAADVEALANWVRRGGKLVYLGRDARLADAENRLLQLPLLLPEVGARGALGGPWSPEVTSVRDMGANRMLLVEHAGDAPLADTNGELVVRYGVGRGEIVAVVDPLPFTNANIADAENARLAYLLAEPRRPHGLVAFDDGLHGALIDRPWYRALPVPVRVTLSIAGFALLLGLAGSALRGGPPMPLAAAREPTSVEFVDALAALHERTGARDAARAVLAHDALAATARGAGPGADADNARRLAAALAVPTAGDADLLATAKLAQLVRKDSSYGGNGNGGRAAFAGGTRTRRRW